MVIMNKYFKKIPRQGPGSSGIFAFSWLGRARQDNLVRLSAIAKKNGLRRTKGERKFDIYLKQCYLTMVGNECQEML